MSEIELKKNLFGGFSIGYDCPHCKSRLKSSLNDAGKTDACPDCKRPFVVPGTEERERLRIQAEYEETERQRKAQEEKEAAKERKATMEQAAVTFSPPPAQSPPPLSEPLYSEATLPEITPVQEFDPKSGHEEVMEDNLKSLVRIVAKQSDQIQKQLDLIRSYIRTLVWWFVVLPIICGVVWLILIIIQENANRHL